MTACKQVGYFSDAQTHGTLCTSSSFSMYLTTKILPDQSSDFGAYFLYSVLQKRKSSHESLLSGLKYKDLSGFLSEFGCKLGIFWDWLSKKFIELNLFL